MEPLGSFLPALNALLQLRVSILPCENSFNKCYRCERGIDTRKEGIDTWLWVSILELGIDTQKPYWNPGAGFAQNRVLILKGGYRYSPWVSILYLSIGTQKSFWNPGGYRYPKGGIDTQMPGRQF
ncbi:hypothetical protein V6N11_072258 [Hibiscus sabdariffa]|uniref:Uncharacterized protein n=1 Tax=Hibiscus sabdariffa TaxID=183260 RepID=A0ABR2U2G9_9ROSI